MTDQTTGAAVRREVTVNAPVERAFDVFTRQMRRGGAVHARDVVAEAERYAEGGDAMREQVDSAGGWGVLLDLYAGAPA
jgi:hypothetical protein